MAKEERNMEDAFEAVRSELLHYDLNSIADSAEVSVNTLHNWIDRKFKPHYDTLIKVARVLDFEIVVTVRK